MGLRSPLPKPGDIAAMAINYTEDGTRDEPAPVNAFHESGNAVIRYRATMILPDVPATIFQGEAELALVIGKPAIHLNQEEAFGYLNFIDGSARELPPAATPSNG